MLDSLDVLVTLPNPNPLRVPPPRRTRTNRERFSTWTVRDPGKINELELDDEYPKSMIQDPSSLGLVRFYHESESLDSSHAGVTATTFQGTTSIITDRSPFQIEGARWHLLTQVLSDQAHFNSSLQTEISLQESLDTDPNYRSFSWQALDGPGKCSTQRPTLVRQA